jgi:hypothetical protein
LEAELKQPEIDLNVFSDFDSSVSGSKSAFEAMDQKLSLPEN